MLNQPIESKTLEAIVYKVLAVNPVTRSDDFHLILDVIGELDVVNVKEIKFVDIIKNHNELGIPSFESITRARRKIQEKEPWLMPNYEVEQQRLEEEKKFREHYSPYN